MKMFHEFYRAEKSKEEVMHRSLSKIPASFHSIRPLIK
ncbi:hypothetical protein EH5_01777 [Bacillus subtilis]|nr:hypothetical protein EH5_01777 [Bacillus subtilis]